MKFKKTTIATLIASLGATTAWALPTVTISQTSPSQIIVPSDGQIDKIYFDTNNNDIKDPKNIGSVEKPIADLNVAQGIDRCNFTNGGGKVTLNVFANKANFEGHGVSLTSYSGSNSSIAGSAFNFDVSSFTSKAGPNGFAGHIALNVGDHSSITVNAKEDVYLEATHSVAMSVGDGSTGNVRGKNITLTANHKSGSSVLEVLSDSTANLTATENITITNLFERNGASGIKLGYAGTLNITAGGTILITNNNNHQRAIELEQNPKGNTYSQNASINLNANDIVLNGYVTASMLNKLPQNGIFLEADNLIKITANVDPDSDPYSRNATIQSNGKGYISLASKDFEINNLSTSEKSVGLYTKDDEAEILGTFSNAATINAMTGIYAYAGNSKFTLNGNAQTQSLLTINSALAGIVAKTRNNSVNDTSVAININYDKNVANPWAPPSGSNGITGLGSYGKGDLLLSNVNSKDKTLSIAVNTSSEYNQDADIITSALSTEGEGKITVKNFDTVNLNVVNTAKKATRYGLYAKSGHIQITEGIGNVFITTTNGNAIFTKKLVLSHPGAQEYDPGVIDLTAKNITLTDLGDKGVGVNSEKGTINVVASDSLSINANEAIKAQSKDSLINVDAKTSIKSLVKGDWSVKEGKATVALGTSALVEGKLKATSKGTIDLSLDKSGTFLGSTATGILGAGTGIVNLTMGEGSVWNVTDNSHATALDLTGTTIDFSRWDVASNTGRANPSYRSITAKTLTGDNDTLRMQIDLGKETQKDVLTDQFKITGKAVGSHIADIKIDGRELVPNKWHSENWLVSQGADSNMSILNKDGTNQFSGNGMTTTWALAFVANGEEDKLNTAEGLAQLVGNTTGNGEGKWYLVRNDEEIVDPNPNPGPDPKPDPDPEQPKPNDPAEMQQITNLGISATQALSFASELEDLRSRLGEVRYGAQDGAWVRAGYAKETADGYNGRGFEQKTHDLHIGLDRIVAADEDSSWLVGGALRYAKSKQEGFTAARGGEGELEQYSAKLYATYMHAQGSYADFVVQAGRYSQDLTGLANDLSSAFKADYKTYGYGASVEIGHMFDFNNQVDDRQWFNHFFIEPQLQLSYFNAHGKDYKTNTGLAVSQSDADFLTGRAGVVLGKKFNYGTADDLDKRYFQVGLKGGVKYEFLGDQTIRFTGVERVTKERKADDVDGARYYYGVTADWQLSHNFRAYATVEREEGDHYTKDFDVSVGVKYQF